MQIPKLAIAIPCYNEELCIEPTCNRLLEVMDMLIEKNKISPESYIYMVDDGSSDRTWEIIERLYNQYPARVKAQKFVKNYGNQKALIAGLEGSRKNGCDCVISIDADLQQDELSIENFVDEYVKGFDVVLGVRNDRKTDTFFKKFTAQIFYKLMNILGAKIPPNHSDYRLVSKKALDVMSMYPEKALFLRGFFHEVGLKTTIVHFNVKPRFAGKSKFNFMSLMGLALNGITSFSIVPLRIIACLGFLMFVSSFLVGVETLCEKIFFNDSPNGYATAIILLCFFGGLQIFCLGIIGEYLGQVYREVKARPRYITEKELV
jgi:glycosyltransferase involved in cell wall biosynthesis